MTTNHFQEGPFVPVPQQMPQMNEQKTRKECHS
jgi:hypothetical protein